MEFSAAFEERFVQVQKEVGRGGARPGPLLESWEHLVWRCEHGYDDNIDELLHDFQNRHSIEFVLGSASLNEYPEMVKFRELVSELDRRFEKLQIRDPDLRWVKDPWWQSYPLRLGGKELAEDYWNMFGIRIQIVP
ncbi:hypothetical protein OU415_09420 [Saccharopolyspora sp. WRP15-2]|uniref:Uncharacterized protein n=1 Tax=Saccharopolyspora oryzae TaxID=2997343 RepID=A0ABT4UVE2_9PSEU|nr:hypothetical protein [Saccharopolyspora oryzae]MDA3625654.1 hypothetical protein [Saccharopolyspora oryzae]